MALRLSIVLFFILPVGVYGQDAGRAAPLPAPAAKTSPTPIATPKSPAASENIDGNGNYIFRWTDVEEGAFKIRFLGKPVRTVKAMDFGFGPVDRINFESETPFGVFILNYMDLPYRITDEKRLRLLYDDLEDDSAKRGNTILGSKDVDIDGYLGRDFLIKMPGDATMTATINMRIVMVDKRCFQLSVIRLVTNRSVTPEKTKESEKHVKDFFDSFSPVKKPSTDA